MDMHKTAPCLWFDSAWRGDELRQDKDAQKRDRAMRALLKMVTLDIAALQRAYDGNVQPQTSP
jgi:hypothetical protein